MVTGCEHLRKNLFDCYKEYPFLRFIGHCSPYFNELQRCILKQHEINRDKNAAQAKAERKQLRMESTERKAE